MSNFNNLDVVHKGSREDQSKTHPQQRWRKVRIPRNPVAGLFTRQKDTARPQYRVWSTRTEEQKKKNIQVVVRNISDSMI